MSRFRIRPRQRGGPIELVDLQRDEIGRRITGQFARPLHLADSATITIDDRGGGLAPEIAGRLFQPFASARPGGAGLGLALARRIVAMHGGTLRLEAREPRGVRAEIRLPFGNIAT